MSKSIGGAPGLYLQGIPSTRAPQLSAIAGFVGIAERGPLHRPQPVGSWDEFEMVFGRPVGYGWLGDEVFGFFRNGGAKCYVVRVADLADHSADNIDGRRPRVDPLRAAQFELNDSNGDATLAIEAINEGRWGNRIVLTLGEGTRPNLSLTTLTADATASATRISVAEVCDLAPNMSVSLADPRDPFKVTGATIVSIDSLSHVVTLSAPLQAALPAGSRLSGRGLKLVVRLDDRYEVFDDLSMSAASPRYAPALINGADDTQSYIDRQALGYSILIRASQVLDQDGRARLRPVSVPAQPVVAGGEGHRFSEGTLQAADGSRSLTLVCRSDGPHAVNIGSSGNSLRVRATAFATSAAVPVNPGDDRIVVQNAEGLIAKDVITIADPANGAVMEDCSIALVQPDNVLVLDAAVRNKYPLNAAVSIKGRFTLTIWAADNPEPVEVHRNLSGEPASPRYVPKVLAVDPATRLGVDGPTVAGASFALPSGEINLAGGRDPGTILSGWYTGYRGADLFAPAGGPPGARYGLATLEELEEVDLVAVPDLAAQRLLATSDGDDPETTYLQAAREVLTHATRCGERLALLDTPFGTTPAQATLLPGKLADAQAAKFGALYYPWLMTSVNGITRLVPPSGFVAGVMARSDAAAGVGQAPANEPIKDVVDLEVQLEAVDQSDLNLVGVNCARKVGALAIELWGARTLSTEPASRYVNVRRLLIAVKKQLGRALRWVAFEPHDAALRRRVEASLTSLVRGLVAGGATASSAADQAFFVACNDETNPPEVVAAGQLVADIGIALAAPAEFIVLNVRRTPDSISVTEDGG
ncbi:phage tail sheath subtilisin-like domain-containing protein [Bradyrhizobium sp. HKCCYLS20291]|uniref:phage tail sheath subtilisin-like domain-containing protein n=1 Tax=Bradyrhizobium sp. HKCCYLS20291 TaxID=3420766 RepID=UPI003EB98CAB